jgi:hypothetical protein
MAMKSVPARIPYVSDEGASHEIARWTEEDNPLWIVVFGVYAKEFVCFPRFTVAGGVIVVARHPGELTPWMRRIEHAAREVSAVMTAGE